MVSPQVANKELVTGMKMTLEEFLRRWEAIPELKKAELIDGVVYVPSPVGLDHCTKDAMLIWWLGSYVVETPGCDTGNNGTWIMLRRLPEHYPSSIISSVATGGLFGIVAKPRN